MLNSEPLPKTTVMTKVYMLEDPFNPALLLQI